MKKRTIIILICLAYAGVAVLALAEASLEAAPGNAGISEPEITAPVEEVSLASDSSPLPLDPSPAPSTAPSPSPASVSKPPERESSPPSAEPAQTAIPTPTAAPTPSASPASAPAPTQEITPPPTPPSDSTPTQAATPVPSPAPSPTPEPTPEPTQAYVPTAADASAYIGSSVYSLYAAIGYPSSGSSYASSCLGEGEDGELYYNGFTVYTYRSGGSETVTAVF